MKGYFYRLLIAAAFFCVVGLNPWMTVRAEESEAAQRDTGGSRVIVCGALEEKETEKVSFSAPGSEEETENTGKQGASLGMHTTTGYCGCELCSGGHELTYSGTRPKANHTISADLEQYPIGTRLMIDGTIYTVEDMGSSVREKMIDIYYDSHEEAAAHGMQIQEVFAVEGDERLAADD